MYQFYTGSPIMHSRFTRLMLHVFLVGLYLGAATMPTAAADPASRGRQGQERSLLDPLLRRTAGDGRCPEIVEMLWALARGSKMAPGEGWFHAGQSRYSWDWLAARFDTDKNGRITREEFQGPGELFDRLDRDGDGVLTKEDFDWSDRSPFLRQIVATSQWFRCIDTNSNGRISREGQAVSAVSSAFRATSSVGRKSLWLRPLSQPGAQASRNPRPKNQGPGASTLRMVKSPQKSPALRDSVKSRTERPDSAPSHFIFACKSAHFG